MFIVCDDIQLILPMRNHQNFISERGWNKRGGGWGGGGENGGGGGGGGGGWKINFPLHLTLFCNATKVITMWPFEQNIIQCFVI